MTDGPDIGDQQLRADLEGLPGGLVEDYAGAIKAMSRVLGNAETSRWARAGVEMAQQDARSWEAASAYFKVSPDVVGSIPHSYFVKWVQCGVSLCRQSPPLAMAYFEMSPATVKKLRARQIETWASLGGTLYKGTWKSSTLAAKFFQTTPALLDSLAFHELEKFVALLDSLSHRSYDLASECLALGQKLFPLIGDDKGAVISLASTLGDTSWRQVKGFFEAGTRALPRIEAGQRLRFLEITERLAKSGGVNVPVTMLEISESLAELEAESHGRILEMSESLLDIAPLAMPEFIKSAPAVVERVTMDRLETWFDEGVRILKQNNDGGLAFFKIESAFSEAVLEAVSSAVDFDRVKDVIGMYCCALAGADIKVAATDELVGKNIGWVSSEKPSTEGSTVFVPAMVDRHPTKDENFAWFKVVSTHQVAHIEFGSFEFRFDRASLLFKNLRSELEAARTGQTDGAQGVESNGASDVWVTDMQRYFNLFQDRKLALDIYTVVEDGRLDARVKAEYPGIKGAYGRVQGDSLAGRAEIKDLPAREAMVEFLVRLSLANVRTLPVPEQYADDARRVARIARRVFVPEATVEDVAEASLRIYAIIAGVENEEVPPEQWTDVDVEEQGQESGPPDDIEDLIEMMASGSELDARPDDEQEYDSTQEVDFRGDFKPELVQLLNMLRMQQQDQAADSEGDPITQEMLEEMLRNSAELEMGAGEVGEAEETTGAFAKNVLKEVGMNLPQTSQQGQGPFVHVDEDGGSLDATEPQTFVYDEWDFRAEDYKPRWCIVRQKQMAEGDSGFFGNTLHNYGPLVLQIRRQFEMMVPETFRKVRRLPDGEDIDIDDVIEAIVDKHTGAGPSEKFYWRRNKVQRDVAVVFLLDTSASTAEAIDDSKRATDDADAPDDPVEYMAWLRSRRGEGARRPYKRIIDVEKEAVVLLVNALEAIGDVYGIYGFSGYGRDNVEFYTVKDIEERFSESVKQRIDRIAPLHATRMGPAIRHATAKLEKQDARTKLLFLISDGRPQDRGYSREGVEKEYAVHDTKMALDEAKRKDVTAFCLTVDKNGHDYLKTMCQDIGYEVLDDVYSLPQRLLFLYKRLTM